MAASVDTGIASEPIRESARTTRLWGKTPAWCQKATTTIQERKAGCHAQEAIIWSAELNTLPQPFPLPPRCCCEVSSLPSGVAGAIQGAAGEGAGGEGGDGDGGGTEGCPDWDRRDARSTAVTALAAALKLPELHSRACDLQTQWGNGGRGRWWFAHEFKGSSPFF